MAHVTPLSPTPAVRPPAAHRVLGDLPFGDGFRRTLPQRPPLTMVGVLAAMAGAMIAAAGLTLLGVLDDPSPWLLVGIGVGLVAVGWVLAVIVELMGNRPGSRTAELVPFGTVLAVIGAPAVAVGLAIQSTRDSFSVSESIAWWPTLIVAVVLLVLWVVPGLQGRPVVLAGALLAGTWTLAAFVAVTVGFDNGSRRPAPSDSTSFLGSPFAAFGSGGLGDGLRAAGIVAFGVGLAFLVLAMLADRARLPGLGTPLIVVGLIAGSLGASAIGPDQAIVRALLPLLVIAVAMAVGVLGGRKATTWLAALAGVSALGQLAVALLGSEPEPGAVAALFGVIGLGLLVAAGAVAALRPGPVSGPSAGPERGSRRTSRRRPAALRPDPATDPTAPDGRDRAHLVPRAVAPHSRR